MKVRIRLESRGSLQNYTWTRVYVLEFKSFLVWSEVGVYSSMDEAKEHLDKFGNPRELIFKY